MTLLNSILIVLGVFLPILLMALSALWEEYGHARYTVSIGIVIPAIWIVVIVAVLT